MSIETGTRLGQYEVQDLIGQGAMGVVYRAYHVQLARTGAVKLMHALTTDADTIARFRREAQAIAQMRHPNILNVFDFGEYQGTPYMIVEYVPGGSLASQLRQEPIDRASAMKYLRGIAAGLDYAHSLGIIHRDVKPANVLLEKDGTPVIADFGLVKLLEASSVRSMTGATTGTPAYMAPEQVTGSQIGPSADRYSLATIAYEMLTGAIPFEGEGLMEVLYAQVHREPPPPSARVPDLGPRVDAVIMRGLHKDPKARWESCEAFVTALGQALAGTAPPAVERTVAMAPPVATTIPIAVSSPVARRATPAADADSTIAIAFAGTEPASSAQAGTPTEPATPRSRKRLFAIAAAVVALLLLLVAVGGYAVIRQRPALFLSANTVRPGDALTVSANHLPANQVGEVRLNSPVHTFAFRADSRGSMSIQLTVPSDIGTGSHIVRICWNAACRLQATLHIVASSAQVTPVAGASPTSGSTPGTTPQATPSANPTSRPGASPTSNPTHAPSPTPTSTAKASPSPSPPPPRSITLSSSTIKILTGTVTVSGAHFNASQNVTISFKQSPTGTLQTWTLVASASGTFSTQITVPPSAVLGSATIVACNGAACASQPITVTAT